MAVLGRMTDWVANMALSGKLEQKLADLAGLDIQAPQAGKVLGQALEDRSNIVVAKAAQLVGKAGLSDLAPALEKAFMQYAAHGGVDKGCMAKRAIASVLYEMGIASDEVFLAGVRHVQREGAVDVAAELRGICALGLVRMGHREALTSSADLLADPERQSRIMGARALAYSGREEAALPLRVKVQIGDADAEVLGECFAALMRLTPKKALELAGWMLDANDPAVAREAALAIGESRLPEAFVLLQSRWRNEISPAKREVLLMPLALLRTPESLEMLTGIISEGAVALALSAVESLGMYRRDESICAKILAAAELRGGEVREAALRTLGR